MKSYANILILVLAFSVLVSGCIAQPEKQHSDLADKSTLVVLGTVTKVKDVRRTEDDGKSVLHQQVVTVSIDSVLKGKSHTNTFVIISPVPILAR